MKVLTIAVLAFGMMASGLGAAAQETAFNPDIEPSRIRWSRLGDQLGPAPDMPGRTFGIVIKTPTNEYWRRMTDGYRSRAAIEKVNVDIQSAQSETDTERQLAIMQNMIGNQYDALLISPISSENLSPAIDDALRANVPIVDIDGAVAENVRYFVGPVNFEMGRRAARWFIDNAPAGGKVAIIQGQRGVLSTVRRSQGFHETLSATGKFRFAPNEAGDWDRRKAHDAARKLIKENPDLIGIYCNNDTMALAAVDAAKELGKLDSVAVIGSDGIGAAYRSIKQGEMKGTVDIFPSLIGFIGLEVAQRVVAGQQMPRVIETPQMLVTRKNLRTYDVSEAELLKVLAKEEQR